MSRSIDTFERLKAKGVEAFKRGEYLSARSYLTDAAECLLQFAETTKSPETRRQQEELAAEIIDLAKECDRFSGDRRGPAGGSGATGRMGAGRKIKEDEGGGDAADWVVREKPDIGFEDIAGLEDVKTEIRLKMIYPFTHRDLAHRYGITVGGGVLLYGPPGTGKTMMARAMAREIDATFFAVSAAQLLSKWVGEAEQNVRKLFDAAKSEPMSIIFFDEAEALVPARTGESSSGVMQRVVPQILQELEGFDRKAERAVLFVAATNQPWLLDEAMLRPGRLDTKVYIGLPDAPARFKLLEIHFGKRPIDEDVDLGELCDRLEGYSGADIKYIAEEAAQRPFLEAIGGREPRPIRQGDIITVIESTPPSVNPATLMRFEKFARGESE